MEQRVPPRLAEPFREEWLKEPTPRRRLRTLSTQLAGLAEFKGTFEEAQRVERALVEHARRMAEKKE